jgi:type II secretion system protein H
MQQNGDNDKVSPAFTLVELILVMAIMITLLALVAPSLARSSRQRTLEQEASRLLALTEYGRDEAVSQGVPMVVWINPSTGHYGLQEQTGYTGNAVRRKDFCLNSDTHFELTQVAATQLGVVHAIELAPDGSPDPASANEIRIVDRYHSAITVSRTSDGWSYEIVKEAR